MSTDPNALSPPRPTDLTGLRPLLPTAPPLTRDESKTLVGKTMALVAMTTALFAVGAYLGRNLSQGSGWIAFAVSIAAFVGLNATVRRSEPAAITLLFAFGVLTGISVAPTLAYYADMNPQTLWQAGGATALFVAGFGTAGYATRRDLSGLARIALWALVALIVFGIVAIFTQIPNAALIYAIVGLVIFAGLIAYDFQRLRRNKDYRTAPLLAASIFLDVINVFLLFISAFDRTDS